MAVTIGETLPWICDFALTSCGWTLAATFEVATAWEWPERDEFQKAVAMIFYQHGDWTPERATDIDPFLERLPLLVLSELLAEPAHHPVAAIDL